MAKDLDDHDAQGEQDDSQQARHHVSVVASGEEELQRN